MELSTTENVRTIPKLHKIGRLESPSLLRFEFRPDPKKHIVLAKLQNLEEQVFFDEVAQSVAKSIAKDSLVFIHGYNVSFEDAARRTGQIAFDLNFIGAPIFYSWPSNNRATAYLKDETNITWSTPHFLKFLETLAERSGAKRIHIIAHSMGNRAVCDALKALEDGLLTGVTIAAYTLWDDHSVNALAVPPLAYFSAAVVLQSAMLAPYALRRDDTWQLLSDHRREVLIVGILSPLAYLLVLFAMRLAPVSLVAPAREISIVFGGLGAWLILREPNPMRRLVGSVVVLAGIAAIALS